MNPRRNTIFAHSEEESDALRELGNVAFSHAATALSGLVGQRVDVSMPSLRVVDPEGLDNEIRGRAEPVCVITLRVLGERRGTLALVFNQSQALALVDILEGSEPGTRHHLNEASRSVLAEVANIMSGAALLSMYRFLRVSLIHGTPMVHVTTRDVVERVGLEVAWSSDVCIVVEAEFSVAGRAARGEMVISLADLRFFLDALANYGGA